MLIEEHMEGNERNLTWFPRKFFLSCCTLLGGFVIEPSHTKKIENGRAKDAGSKSPELADPISILQASRFGQTPFVDTEATNTNPT
jgi:hypothetical protein